MVPLSFSDYLSISFRQKILGAIRGQRPSIDLISKELAPYEIAGCRGIAGPVPPPLSIRHFIISQDQRYVNIFFEKKSSKQKNLPRGRFLRHVLHKDFKKTDDAVRCGGHDKSCGENAEEDRQYRLRELHVDK